MVNGLEQLVRGKIGKRQKGSRRQVLPRGKRIDEGERLMGRSQGPRSALVFAAKSLSSHGRPQSQLLEDRGCI